MRYLGGMHPLYGPDIKPWRNVAPCWVELWDSYVDSREENFSFQVVPYKTEKQTRNDMAMAPPYIFLAAQVPS